MFWTDFSNPFKPFEKTERKKECKNKINWNEREIEKERKKFDRDKQNFCKQLLNLREDSNIKRMLFFARLGGGDLSSNKL